MARGRKKRREGRQMVRRLTPRALREFWEALPEEAKPLTLRGEEIGTLDDLLAIHAREPRKVDNELTAVSRAARRRHERRAKEIDAEATVKEREAGEMRAARAFMERLEGLGVRELDEEAVEALKGLPQSSLDALYTIARLQRRREARGAGAFRVDEVGGALGMSRAEVGRLVDFAERAGLASVDRASETLMMSITSRGEEPSFDLGEPDPANLGLENQGVCTLPTTTLRHFSRIAREEGLPKALSEEALADLAVLARHIVAGTEVLATEDGRHFIRAHLICAARRRLVDSPDSGGYGDVLLVDAVKDLLHPELPPVLEDIRRDWLAAEWLRREPDGSWHWNLAAHEIESAVDEWELRNMGEPTQLEADLPLRQLGLLIEAGQWKPLPDDGGQMPIHAGARSFESIWRRQSLLADAVRRTGEAVRKAGAEQVGTFQGLMRPQIAWSARGMMAPAFLGEMRVCRTVAVDLDVAEGLPDWESLEEAWAYAQDAELPFPVTYFDFTTPGGYRPKVVLQTGRGREETLTLRAALCRKEGGFLRIAPFAWFAEAEHVPDELRRRTDYDVPGTVHFGLAPRLGEAEELEDVTHLRLTSEEGLSAPSQMMLTQPLLGRPGWVDLYSDLTSGEAGGGDEEEDARLRAEAMIAVAAAGRVLSVIYALDSTVNIELSDAEPTRPERRAVERALRRGQDALISKTVRIHPTRQTEARREAGTAKREYSHAHWRRGHFAHYPLGTQMADRLAETDVTKLVDHPVKGLCRKVYRPPTIVGATGPDGEEREPVAKSYVWGRPAERRAAAAGARAARPARRRHAARIGARAWSRGAAGPRRGSRSLRADRPQGRRPTGRGGPPPGGPRRARSRRAAPRVHIYGADGVDRRGGRRAMSIDPPTPDAHQSMAIRRWIADLEVIPGVAEVLGRRVIDREEFLGDEELPAPEGICVEIRFRRRGEDPRLEHRLQVGPIAPGGGRRGGGAGAPTRPRPLRGRAMPSDLRGCPRIPRDLTSGGEQS